MCQRRNPPGSSRSNLIGQWSKLIKNIFTKFGWHLKWHYNANITIFLVRAVQRLSRGTSIVPCTRLEAGFTLKLPLNGTLAKQRCFGAIRGAFMSHLSRPKGDFGSTGAYKWSPNTDVTLRQHGFVPGQTSCYQKKGTLAQTSGIVSLLYTSVPQTAWGHRNSHRLGQISTEQQFCFVVR